MAEIIHEYGTIYARETAYQVVALGQERDDGTWIGWPGVLARGRQRNESQD
jgi:hypothetical protein